MTSTSAGTAPAPVGSRWPSLCAVVEVSDAEREGYRRDGFVVLRDVLDGAARARLAAAIDACRAAPSTNYRVLSPRGLAPVDSDLFRAADAAAIAWLGHRSALPRIAAELLDSPGTVVFVEDQWFASAPGSATPSPWHQDSPYYAIDRPFVTMWCPIDPVPPSVALQVVPGSHAWGRSFAPVEFAAEGSTIGATGQGATRLEPVPDVGDGAVVTDARAGDVVAFDARLLHAAGGAVETDFRRFSLRFAPATARYVRPAWPVASFWDELPHGLGDGDLLACDVFPTVTV